MKIQLSKIIPKFTIPEGATHDEYVIQLDGRDELWIASGFWFYRLRDNRDRHARTINFNMLERIGVHIAVMEYLGKTRAIEQAAIAALHKSIKTKYLS